jgi:phytoene dehydrogenase-like protein
VTARVDGIVIGSGPNGLVTAAYLARAGLRVTVLERNDRAGGGASTEEATLPGFRHNLHSNFHAIGAGPVVRDLGLERHGLHYLYPEVQHAFLFRDRSAICLYADAERTAASIARFSPRDATRYVELHERFGSGPMGIFLRRSLFQPPLDDDALTERVLAVDPAIGREYLHYRALSLYEAVDEAFEDDRVRTVIKHHCHGSAYQDAPGTGHFVLRIVARSGWSGLAIGGAASLARALVSVIEANGGAVLTGRSVAEVRVSAGRAAGVTLDDGEQVDATRFVVSSLDPAGTVGLVGADALGPEVADGMRAYRPAARSLATVHLALAEAPRYLAAETEPDVDRAYGVYLGADSSQELTDTFAAIARSEVPERFMGNGACNTRFDPSQAPEGHHAAFWWPFAPYAIGEAGPAAWDDQGEAIADRIVREWSAYAPNIAGPGVVLGRHLFSPRDIERHIPNMVHGSHHGGAYVPGQIDGDRPTRTVAHYRTPVEGLYLTGAGTHPGGSINGAPGYNTANAIVEDLGIEPWWVPVGRGDRDSRPVVRDVDVS